MMKFDDHVISTIKKRRTKRPRQPSPPVNVALRMANSSSSSKIQCGSGGGGDDHFSGTGTGGFDHRSSASSPSNSDDNGELSMDLLEEDMANCLILLAQGHRGHDHQEPPLPPFSAPVNKELYECKTCNRIFPSFQALGGHRASHKKPKTSPSSSSAIIPATENQENNNEEHVTKLSLQIPLRTLPMVSNHKNRIHECCICGAEFASGQALGGHMRRHRPLPPNSAVTAAPATTTTTSSSAGSGGREDWSQETKNIKPRSLLAFDLNLPAPAPAPEEDRRETSFPFTSSKERVIVFSTSTLVDCHY